MSNWSVEETDDPLSADDRNFYKVEQWTEDDLHIDRLLYAGSNLRKARDIFADRPQFKLTRTRVLERWPR
jgi:hypothetical protein